MAVSPTPSVPESLPLLSLYLTERCNSRCVTCDHWRHGRTDLSTEAVQAMLPSLLSLRTRIVQLSGGEPLVHPHWNVIAELLRQAGLEVWLLTAGLALAKHAAEIARCIDVLIVSLDAADAPAYREIRGIDAFDKVCEGIRRAAQLGLAPSLRVTVQRRNFRQLPRLVRLAHDLGAARISFLAVDTANVDAFGRRSPPLGSPTLVTAELPEFSALIERLETDFAADFASGFIAQTPAKLRRIHQHFAATLGQAAFPRNDCRAPEFSAVVDARGRMQPCFFIGGGDPANPDLSAALGAPVMRELRAQIRAGERTECRTCVCTLSRAPAA